MRTKSEQSEKSERKEKNSGKTSRPAMSEEARENQMIALAVDLAEKKLRDGTASNQIIVHYLRLGSTKERIENEIREKEKELITAKTEALTAAKDTAEMYERALNALKSYKGETDEDDEREYTSNY